MEQHKEEEGEDLRRGRLKHVSQTFYCNTLMYITCLKVAVALTYSHDVVHLLLVLSQTEV